MQKTVVLQVRISADEYARLEKLAKEIDSTKSSIVRALINGAVASSEPVTETTIKSILTVKPIAVT
jgi:predicted DNA-binding protein